MKKVYKALGLVMITMMLALTMMYATSTESAKAYWWNSSTPVNFIAGRDNNGSPYYVRKVEICGLNSNSRFECQNTGLLPLNTYTSRPVPGTWQVEQGISIYYTITSQYQSKTESCSIRATPGLFTIVLNVEHTGYYKCTAY